MKPLIVIVLVLLSSASLAQKIERFYDYKWEPCDKKYARYYSTVENKNGLWERKAFYLREKGLQMRGYFLDSACKVQSGQFHFYHPNRQLSSTGMYVNGKKQGLWLSYYDNGAMKDSINFEKGVYSGGWIKRFRNGVIKDSGHYDLVAGEGYQKVFFSNGRVSEEGAVLAGKLSGMWTYYHSNGHIARKVEFVADEAKSSTYYDESGKQVNEAVIPDGKAVFKTGWKAFRRYILDGIDLGEFTINNAEKMDVVVRITIDEKGKASDVEIVQPISEKVDNMIVDTIKRLPLFKPAAANNRHVPYTFNYVICFGSCDED